MTAQFSEALLIDAEAVGICTNPLDSYFSLGGKRPAFDWRYSTALWRGCIGTWEIVDERLYLTKLTCYLEGGTEATLVDVFPGYPDRVFAHWYTGTLRIPKGERLKYVHMGYSSTYEKDLLFDVEKGVLQQRRIRENEMPQEDSRK
jgi:hypothetical protein